MKALESHAAEYRGSVSAVRPALDRLTRGLLIAGAVVYAAGAALVVFAGLPAAAALGLLAGACGLVGLACAVGALGAVRSGRRPEGRQIEQEEWDEWVEWWETLMTRPVR